MHDDCIIAARAPFFPTAFGSSCAGRARFPLRYPSDLPTSGRISAAIARRSGDGRAFCHGRDQSRRRAAERLQQGFADR